MNNFTDEELRVIFLPHVIKLLDQDTYRARGECNTTVMGTLVGELINVVRYGTPAAPKESEVVEAPAVQAQQQAQGATFA